MRQTRFMKVAAALLALSLIFALMPEDIALVSAEETDGYIVTFSADEGITIDIYYTQDYTSASETDVTSAVARDSDSGEVDTSGDGQVNFKVNVAEGYTLGSVSADGNYKNLKDSADTGVDGIYRLTKITGAVTVTVTATKDSTDDGEDGDDDGDEDDTADGFAVTFSVDEGITIDIYYTQDYTSASETDVTSAVARDSSTGEVDTSGDGQVNFKVNVADGYTLGSVSASGNYKNLKDSADTGEDGIYRLTKITGAVTVTVTATKDSTDDGEDGDGDGDGNDEGGDDEEETASANDTTTGFENGSAALSVSLLNSINIGTANTDGGVAEIVAYNSDNETAYTVNGQDGKLYYFAVTSSGLTQKGSLDVEAMIEAADADFSYGDLTSVAVDTVNDHIALAIQAEGYADSGRVALLDYDLNLITVFETGVQPDMVTFSPDGSVILTADEGEPREGYGEGTTDPAGTITIIDLANEKISYAGFGDFTASELTATGILLGIVDGETIDPEYDLEPEYITVSSDGSTAYVTLQEANAIAVVDIDTATVTSVQSLGFKDYSDEDNAVDLQDDGTYSASTYENVLGVYMPDTISSYEVNGTTYLVTANEGDAREWGDYTNETKVTLTASDGSSNKVRALDASCVTLPDSANTYLFGGRSFAIYQVGANGTLTQVYESGSDFEAYTAQYLSAWFNCSNDDIEIDSRSQKKGPEPEGVAIGTIDGRTYAFIGLERIGGIMIYDITDPSNATYVNYINTRDFSDDIAGDVSPEGLALAVLSDGTPVLLAAYEVSGNLASYSFSDADSNAVTASGSASSYSAYTVTSHNTYEVTSQQEATCTEEGSVTYTCSFCGDTYTETLTATGHTYLSDVTDPTCTQAGYTTYTCSVCGETYTADETDAAGHSYGSDYTFTWSDDYSSASAIFSCSVCGETCSAEVTVTIGEDESGNTVYTAIITGPDGSTFTEVVTAASSSGTDEETDDGEVQDSETDEDTQDAEEEEEAGSGEETPSEEEAGSAEEDLSASDGRIEATDSVSDSAPQTSAAVDEAALAQETLTRTESAAVEAGGKATYTLIVRTQEDEAVAEEDIPIAEDYLSSVDVTAAYGNLTAGFYLDISLYLTVTDAAGNTVTAGEGDTRRIDDTGAAVYTITVTIPADLVSTDSTVTRTFRILRVHDGTAEILESVLSGAADGSLTLTFETSLFSTYAILYADTETAQTQEISDAEEGTGDDESEDGSAEEAEEDTDAEDEEAADRDEEAADDAEYAGSDEEQSADAEDDAGDEETGKEETGEETDTDADDTGETDTDTDADEAGSLEATDTGDAMDLSFWLLLLSAAGAALVLTMRRTGRS